MRLLRNIGLAFALGAVCFALSERLFWSFWKPDDSTSELLVTYLFYSLSAYILLVLIEKFTITTVSGLVLVGALYGWIVEGVFVPEVYGMLPYSIVFTALSWHMLFTILFGYYWCSKSILTRQPVIPTLIFFGVLWGVYALYPGSDPENSTWTISVMAFATHAVFTTCCWIIGLFAFIRLKPVLFQA